MSLEDKEFISILNTYYPFERYILINPKSIEPTFDDLILTEIFIPYTKSINIDEIYVKVKDAANNEIRIGYYDFAQHIRNKIRYIIQGELPWQSLYTDYVDMSNLKRALLKQKSLIETKYGNCNIKENTANSYLVV